MSCTTQRVLLTMLLYELLRRQRRRDDGGEDDDDDDDDDEEEEDDGGDEDDDEDDGWTEESDSEDDDEDDESSSSYEDDYEYDDDYDDDDDEEDERNRPPKLDPTQLEQLPKVEKKAFCQKWILGQRNVDYLLKEEPLRSPSARLAKTPPPPEPPKQTAVPSIAKDVQKVSPNKRKLDDVVSTNSRVMTKVAVAGAAGTTTLQQFQQPVKIIRIQNSAATAAAAATTYSQRMTVNPTSLMTSAAQQPIKVIRIQNSGSTPNGTYPKLVTTIGPTGQPVKTLLVQNELPSGSKVVVANGTVVPRLVNSTGQPVKLIELQKQQQQKRPLTSLVSNGGGTAADVPSKKPKIEEVPVTVTPARTTDALPVTAAITVMSEPSVVPPVKKSRRLTSNPEPESGTVLRRSARLVNARKIYS